LALDLTVVRILITELISTVTVILALILRLILTQVLTQTLTLTLGGEEILTLFSDIVTGVSGIPIDLSTAKDHDSAIDPPPLSASLSQLFDAFRNDDKREIRERIPTVVQPPNTDPKPTPKKNQTSTPTRGKFSGLLIKKPHVSLKMGGETSAAKIPIQPYSNIMDSKKILSSKAPLLSTKVQKKKRGKKVSLISPPFI
jgi:hypothetical protein